MSRRLIAPCSRGIHSKPVSSIFSACSARRTVGSTKPSNSWHEPSRSRQRPQRAFQFRMGFARREADARGAEADLFIDIFPYCTHPTAGETLSAGLPVVTCAGKATASRIAGTRNGLSGGVWRAGPTAGNDAGAVGRCQGRTIDERASARQRRSATNVSAASWREQGIAQKKRAGFRPLFPVRSGR